MYPEMNELIEQYFLSASFLTLRSFQSQRYAAPQQEEIEAERSIHVEAIERSRASQADLGRSMMNEEDDGESSLGGGYAPDDFGGGDDDGDFPIEGFSLHDGDHRFSSESFQTTFEASQPASQATVLLDAIAAGDILGSQSNYEYFNSQALENIQGNMWAGAAHWKKMRPRRKPKAAANEKDAPGTVTKKRKGRTAKTKSNGFVVNLSKVVENLDDLLRKPHKSKKKGSDPLQLTKAAQTKHSKNENLLPLDVGMGVDSLTSLFLRPNSSIMEMYIASKPTKNVGFGGVETWGNDDDSYGGDDHGGAGYDFGGDGDNDLEEFVVPELEGVRKVEKVHVGYATVAKKVDVKRLKHDLWVELESTFQQREDLPADDDEELKEKDDDGTEIDEPDVPRTPKNDGHLSFQETVREMQSTQTQTDVTLPFYFICVLHLANEKGLALESMGLEDFVIHSS
jgi:condensin complex subunit 2